MFTSDKQPKVVLLALLLGCILAGFVLIGAWTLHTSTKNCERVAQIDRVIQQQGVRGLKTFGKPGGVGYAYYHDHPRELQLVKTQLRQQIRDFRPPSCSGLF